MRVGIAMVMAGLFVTGLSAAADTEAAVRKAIQIPPQDLGTALKMLAKSRGFQIVFVSEEVEHLRTRGASGVLTSDEALTQLLSGTGLTYTYIADKGVAVGPAASAPDSSGQAPERSSVSTPQAAVESGSTPVQQSTSRATRSWRDAFRVAQADPAAAQEASAAQPREADTGALAEIVVSAQRREQRFQDVPISATVVSGAVIEQIGAQGLQDVLAHTINVDASQDGGASNHLDLSIRGVRPLFDGNQNTFGVFVDGFNVAPVAIDLVSSGSTFNNSLIDVERIEVLRGPQGTYFGRNVMGGAISIVTQKPDENVYFKGNVDSSSDNTLDLRALVNVPLRDDLFVRLSGQKYTTDGPVTNYGPGRSLRYLVEEFPEEFPDNFGTRKWDQSTSWSALEAARVAVRYLPTDRLTIDLTYTHQVKERGPLAAVAYPGAWYDPANADDVEFYEEMEELLGSLPPDPLGLGYWPTNQSKIALSESVGAWNRTSITTANLKYAFGGFAVESVTGYIDTNIDADRDRDASLALQNARSQYATVNSFSQEIRGYSTSDGPLQWLLGAMYAEDNDDGLRLDYWPGGDSDNQHVLFGTPEGDALLPAVRRFNQTRSNFKTKSVFGELTWSPVPRLDLAIGGRYAEDSSYETATDWTADLERSDQLPVTAEGSSFSPKVSVSFEVTDDVTAYAVASQGYRPGGSNSLDVIEAIEELATDFGVNLDINPVFEEEVLRNYEVGAKGRFLGNRLHVNAAAFVMDYTDLQSSAFIPLPDAVIDLLGLNFELTQNVAGAEIKGVELEFAARLGQRFELSGGVGLLDTAFDDYQFIDGDGNVRLDISGEALPKARDWSAYLAGLYTYPINATWNGFVRGDLTAVSSAANRGAFNDLGRFPERNTLPDYPGYEVFNLRIGFETDRYSIMAYVNNVLEEDYYTNYMDKTYGALVDVHPRVFGLRFSASFDGGR